MRWIWLYLLLLALLAAYVISPRRVAPDIHFYYGYTKRQSLSTVLPLYADRTTLFS